MNEYGEEIGLTREIKEAANVSRADQDGAWRRRGALGSGGALALDPRKQPGGPPVRVPKEPRRGQRDQPPPPVTRAAQIQQQQQQQQQQQSRVTTPNSRGGPPGVPRGAVQNPPRPHVVAKDEAKEDDAGALNPLNRTIDVYWQSYPQEKVWIRKSRRESVKETKSRMPLVLRNLAPDTAFDPRVMWEAEKKKAADDAAAAKDAVPDAKKKNGGQKTKPKKLSKKDELIEKNKKEQEDKDVRSDLEKLDNAAKACRNKAEIGTTVFGAKVTTALGKLRQLFMVLEAELKQENDPVVLDVLWAIEANSLYGAALDQDDDDGDLPVEKEDKKKKKSKDSEKKKPTTQPTSKEAALVREFRKELKAAKRLRKDRMEKLAVFQLEKMYDRLPPLSPFLKGWKLDSWQKKVLHHVDQRQSVIVCAPTSSGKTVISTYTCVNYDRVLFVVPTEPLVWQVAAMFEKLLQGSAKVALATNQLAYRPSEDKSKVVVGTPLALESALVKIRGVVGGEVTKRWDYAQLDGGFDDFDYAVFDEVHALDGDEGAALQRLIRSVSCPTLALSATVGNAPALRDWWHSVRADCLEEGDDDDDVVLVEHKGRFINVQNLVLDPKKNLQLLHPCSALTSKRLLLGKNKDEDVEIKLTPTDASALYTALAAEYKDDVKDLEPNQWFEKLAADDEAKRLDELEKRASTTKNPVWEEMYRKASSKTASAKAGASSRSRITLDEAKRYGEVLKERLVEYAEKDPDRVDSKILQTFIPTFLKKSENQQETFSMLDVATQMRSKLLFPALAFHLDSFRCLNLFKSLVAELEAAEHVKYPTWADELRAKAETREKQQEAQDKLKEKNAKQFEDDARDGFGDEGGEFVDVTMPHPDFVLAPPTARLSAKEIDDILVEIEKDTNNREKLEASHVLVRALRRGFAIYIDDAAFAVYRRVVQRLAQQGKLAIVFSDASLAYGVNMPFRTVAFCGDEGNLLTPLLAQQMAGRAGRRGLDNQGNLVYLGMDWDRIRQLMVGTVPAILGKDPYFPTMALPYVLSSEVAGTDKLCDFVNRKCMRRLCAASLAECVVEKKVRPAKDCDSCVTDLLKTIDILGLKRREDEDKKPDDDVSVHTDVRPALCMVWELRGYLAESVALHYALPELMADFVKDRFNFKRADDDAASEAVQIEFLSVILHIVDRHPAPEGTTPLSEISWLTKNPDRVAKWAKWEKILTASQDRLNDLPESHASALRLPVPPGEPIDAMVFEVAKDRRLPPASAITSLDRHNLKLRIWHLGNILLKAHNCLQLPGQYHTLSPLLRKSYSRIKYILADDIKADVDERDIQQLIAQRAGGDDDEDADGGAD